MTELRAVIDRVAETASRLTNLPNMPAVQRAAQKIILEETRDGRRSDRDYDAIASSIAMSLANDAVLARRVLSDSVWCLWTTTPALAENQPILDKLLIQVEGAERPRLIRSLAASFLQSFQRNMPGLNEVSRLLQRTAPLARAPYSELQERFELFDVERGPERIASEILDRQTSVPDYFRRKGMGAQTSSGGYARKITELAFGLLQKDQNLKGFERLEKVRLISLDSEGDLQFEELRPNFANALLLPYQNRDPDKAERDKTLELLLEIIGDPRSESARWSPMQDAKEIALQWFTEQSLRQFLDIVDQVADRRMWRYRRAFWEAVHARGMIDSAWVVFDAKGAREARARFGQSTKFGRFSGSVGSGQAVLVLQIGSSVVAEWSHNGRCHIWSNSAGGPHLHKLRYSAQELRATSSGNFDAHGLFSHSHMSPDTYSWQKKVATKLSRLTGVRLSQSEYKVTRYG